MLAEALVFGVFTTILTGAWLRILRLKFFCRDFVGNRVFVVYLSMDVFFLI
jgi:hypothetical protein